MLTLTRTYYGRGGRNSMLPRNYSTDNVQDTVYDTEAHTTNYDTGVYTTDHSPSETSLQGIQPPKTRDHYIGHSYYTFHSSNPSDHLPTPIPTT